MITKIKYIFKHRLAKYLPLVGLILVAVVWGSTFSVQKRAMMHLPAFQFIAIRFLVASITLMVILKIITTRSKAKLEFWNVLTNKQYLKQGLILGVVVFLGTSFQQIALLFTSVANTGFITTAYVVVVPMIMFIFNKTSTKSGWTAAVLSFIGVFILSGANFSFYNFIGDSLALINAICWGLHLVLCRKYAHNASYVYVLVVTIWQSLVTVVLALVISFIIQEPYIMLNFKLTWGDVLFSGVFAAGIANFVQILSQKNTDPTHAAVVLSLEGMFAAIAAWIIINEPLSISTSIGGVVMILACIISQLSQNKDYKK